MSPILNMMPEDALRASVSETVRLLIQTRGEHILKTFDPEINYPGPFLDKKTTNWIKSAKCVGINVRTIGHFWNIVPYALGLPSAQNAIHILPIWEPGVVASLYGPASWNINPEFFSPALHAHFPHLDTVEKQLKVVANILHALGKAVGMDVVPHTDRFSEIVLANPQHFEWLVRDGLRITDHSADLHERAQGHILEFLRYRGSAVPGLAFPDSATDFFGENFPEEQRLRVLFGEKHDYGGRLKKRNEFVNLFYQFGLETAPATMGPPYRGLEVDPNPEAKTVDNEGRVWRDFKITRPQKFSRAFGPLTRYKLYEPKNNNSNWELDFSKPRPETWDYVCQRYAAIQREFGFDFMRGDMSHVQMRPDGVPPASERDAYYDLLGAVKQRVLHENPSFGYFAESFLAPPDEMAFGDECDHLEASLADSTLGDLQSEPVGTVQFMKMFAQYRTWLETRDFAPNFTIMTADKDDPRFDKFYLTGNELRYFLSIFLTDMPSYMGLGFECRDPHPAPAPNEHYTKLYVFQMQDGPKGTHGPYVWGKNRRLYFQICRIKQFAEAVFEDIRNAKTHWLLAPDARGKRKTIAWTQLETDPHFVFAANFDTEKSAAKVKIPLPKAWAVETVRVVFSTVFEDARRVSVSQNGNLLELARLEPGEVVALGKFV